MNKAGGERHEDDPLFAPGLKLRKRANMPAQRIWLATEKDRRAGFYKCHVAFPPEMSDERVASECREMWNMLVTWRSGMSPNPLMFGRVHKKERQLPDLAAYLGNGLVYFVQAQGGERLIKIGFTTDIDERLAGLITGCPYPLKLLATYPGPRGLESWLHSRFMKERRWGEWFLPTRELITWATHFYEELEHFKTTRARTNVPFRGRCPERRGTTGLTQKSND